MDPRVTRFVKLHSEVNQLLKHDQYQSALTKYEELASVYEDIRKSSLGHLHKELAYKELTGIYNKLDRQAPRTVLLPILLLTVLSIAMFTSPSIIGFSIMPDKIVQQENLYIAKSGFYNITLEGIPTSLNARGSWEGQKAKLYLVQGKVLLRIFDSTKTKQGRFPSTCIDTCKINPHDNKLTLLAEVTNATMNITYIDYKARPLPNNAPEWRGPTAFPVKETLTIELSKYFSDKDGDKLTYLSTTDEDLEMNIEGSKLEINTIDIINGTRMVTVLASDLKDVTRVPLLLAFS